MSKPTNPALRMEFSFSRIISFIGRYVLRFALRAAKQFVHFVNNRRTAEYWEMCETWSSSNRCGIIYPQIASTHSRTLSATPVGAATIILPVSKLQKWAVLHFNVCTYTTWIHFPHLTAKIVNFSLVHLSLFDSTYKCVLAYFAFFDSEFDSNSIKHEEKTFRFFGAWQTFVVLIIVIAFRPATSV